jgi:glycerophosphoryl diester phosphodiesterase
MKIIGHRGARGLAPENTLASLQKGLQHHVDMLEFDVRVTKDGVPVLHHDAAMRGAKGEKMMIREYTFTELKHHFPDLATLQQALDLIDTRVTAYIEVKEGEATKPIVDKLKEYLESGMYMAKNLRLASKSQKTLRELHRGLPEVPVIVIERWSGVRAHRRAKELGAKEIAMFQAWLWWGFIRGFKNSDKKLYAYTLNDPAKARRWAKWGLAGAVTDYPDRFEH